MESMHLRNLSGHEPGLPLRSPRKTVTGLKEEREREAWYWRGLASLASMLIAIGYLIFGGAFLTNTTQQANRQTVPVTAVSLVVINSGYLLSVALWFLRRNWIYQLECIFIPCLSSSFLGLINSVVVPLLVLENSELTAPALASLLVSLASTLIYSTLTFFTWRRLQKLKRQDGLMKPSSLTYVSEEELQRRQMNNLLMQREEVSAATLASDRTYHIDFPVPKTPNRQQHDTSQDSQSYGY